VLRDAVLHWASAGTA